MESNQMTNRCSWFYGICILAYTKKEEQLTISMSYSLAEDFYFDHRCVKMKVFTEPGFLML